MKSLQKGVKLEVAESHEIQEVFIFVISWQLAYSRWSSGQKSCILVFNAIRSLLKKIPKNTYNKIMISTTDTPTFHSTFPVGTGQQEELVADKGHGAAMSSRSVLWDSCEPDLSDFCHDLLSVPWWWLIPALIGIRFQIIHSSSLSTLP